MAAISPSAKQQFFDSNGDVLVGGLLYTRESGTATPKTSYTDESEDTANANPIVLDSRGECDLWLTSGEAYRLRLEDSLNNLIWQVDDIVGGSAQSSSVSSIADLKNVGPDELTLAHVLGYYADGDGGGGLFYWDADSTASDNGGTIIELNSTPATGRWLRLFDGDVSIRWFGAKGDYTGGTGTDDRDAINNTASYCNTNNLNMRVPEGAYFITNFLTCAVSIIGDQKGKIETTAVYGAAAWDSIAAQDLTGSVFVFDRSTLGTSDVYIRNASGADSSDVQYINMTFISESNGSSVGGGKLVVNDSGASGTEFNFGPNQTFRDCNIVNFGTAITYNLGTTWHLNTINFMGCQQPLEMGNASQAAFDVTVSECNFSSCGDTSTAFIKLDHVQGFLFDRCRFNVTSEISLRIALNKGLSFTGCFMNDASLNSAGDFITVVSTAGYDVDAVSLTNCMGNGSVGDINLIQGTNVSTLLLNECELTGCTVPLGTSYVSILKIGYVNIDGTSGTGTIDTISSTAFSALGIAFGASGAQRRIETQTADGSDDESITMGGGGNSSDNARGGNVEAFGDDHSTSAGKVIVSGASAGASEGDIELTTGATAQVNVTSTTDTTSGATGAMTIKGGLGVVKNIYSDVDIKAGGLLSGDGLEINTIYTETMSGGGSGTSGSTAALAGVIANAPTTLTILATSVQSDSLILFTLERSAGLTDTLAPCITSKTASTNFIVDEITAGATIHWIIINPV